MTSFYAPYACDACGREESLLIDAVANAGRLAKLERACRCPAPSAARRWHSTISPSATSRSSFRNAASGLKAARARSLRHFVQDFVRRVGYPGLFLLIMLESTLVPIPSELVMPFAGLLAARGEFSLP